MYIVINDEKERWVPLFYNDIRDIYDISNYGNIRFRSDKKLVNILKYDYNPYNLVSLQVNQGANKTFFVHILVAYSFIEHPKKSDIQYIVNHKDSDRRHNYYKNLEFITYWDNTKHGIIHGYIKGTTIDEDGNKLLYDDAFIDNILVLLEQGKNPSEICSELNIDINIQKQVKSLIKDLKSGRTHKDKRKNYNIPYKKRNLFPIENVRKICELLEQGYNKDQIFDILNIKSDDDIVLYNRKFYAIVHGTEFVSITKQYNFQKYDKEFNTYSKELIHNICSLLQDNYSREQIIDKLNLPNDHKIKALIYDIYKRRSNTKISKEYKW